MTQKRITALVVAITLALLGLLFVQVKWVSDTLELKDRQYNEDIDNALVAVAEQLERSQQATAWELPDDGTRLPPIHRLAPIHWDSTSGPSIVGAGTPAPRIDPRLLDSLITAELARRNIKVAHQHGVFTGNGTVLLIGPEQQADTALIWASTHRVELFRGPVPATLENGCWLHLVVPERPSELLHNTLPLVVATLLFLLLIATIFGLTLRMVMRQKRLGDIKNDLVNNLTHELKTPISTISLACEALNDPGIPKDPAQVRHFTNLIRDENKRLGQLVESVLQSAVLESGTLQLRTGDVDMHALLAEVVRTCSLQVTNRGGTLTLEPRAGLAHVRGDRTHLTNIFYNLVDNAVKYCSGPPQVRISTRSDAKYLSVEVADNGIGIPKSEQSKVFDRLYRVPTGNVHNVKGFGLGLSYVRSVVERHGGRIRVESDPEGYSGAGSRFIIELPFEHGETR